MRRWRTKCSSVEWTYYTYIFNDSNRMHEPIHTYTFYDNRLLVTAGLQQSLHQRLHVLRCIIFSVKQQFVQQLWRLYSGFGHPVSEVFDDGGHQLAQVALDQLATADARSFSCKQVCTGWWALQRYRDLRNGGTVRTCVLVIGTMLNGKVGLLKKWHLPFQAVVAIKPQTTFAGFFYSGKYSSQHKPRP